ncbi:hypothetical protein [Tenacibaculum mesophilum]|uniref:Uncharacterized protein n=1 Tax=Tenacibaculum mesophilum TaxID=104268 RepID=A0ABN5TAH3_9FLAO|nr:hypothetical protein [Tenacibaculum mesophilum]AZJ33495.1 hypothetical protein D6200_13340 [Tenacibaculum mesophilum]QFS28735.1 hypothetical protein F9Y86_10150 [Tenacibaculum mesophilum]SHF59731.1 hypothetical protein SAMN05444344_0707 [Tenacibaculum mesophilum]
MNFQEAKKHIAKEYQSDDGLDTLFRMSADVEEERIARFLQALRCLQEHYTEKPVIEKEVAFQLFSINETLKASMGHWKVNRPKGLDHNTCWKIIESIRCIFSD